MYHENDIYTQMLIMDCPGDNFLISAEEMHSVLVESGFIPESFEDASDEILNGPPVGTIPEVAVQIQLGLSVFVDNLAEKAGNARRSLQERQIRFVRGVFRVK